MQNEKQTPSEQFKHIIG